LVGAVLVEVVVFEVVVEWCATTSALRFLGLSERESKRSERLGLAKSAGKTKRKSIGGNKIRFGKNQKGQPKIQGELRAKLQWEQLVREKVVGQGCSVFCRLGTSPDTRATY
jgi:hypothetical protein